MRTLTVLGAVLILTLPGGRAHAQTAALHPLVTQAEYERWQTELSNWGRWGKDDQLGTLNLITPAKRKQAAVLAKEGFTVSLARDANFTKEVDNPCPQEWALTTDLPDTVTDRIAYPCIHGPGTTHLDSFAHMFFDRKMWNGYSRNLVTIRLTYGESTTYRFQKGLECLAGPEKPALVRNSYTGFAVNIRAVLDLPDGFGAHGTSDYNLGENERLSRRWNHSHPTATHDFSPTSRAAFALHRSAHPFR
jgi:hypothetical protein